MTVSQKAALSLLISVFLFAGVAVLAFTGLFDLMEARFYDPSITKSLSQEIKKDTETVQSFLSEFQSRFSATLAEPAVRRSFLPNQSAEDIFERTRIYGVLLETTGGLQSVRFVDAGGIRLHFSTYGQDILSQDRLSVAYRNYTDGPGNLPYEQVQNPAQGEVKLILDDTGDRIIFSFPFYDSFDVYRGTALFTMSVRSVSERLVSTNRIKIGENVAITSAPSGIVSGIPGAGETEILAKVSEIWSSGLLTLTPLDSVESNTSLALISSRTSQGVNVGRLVNESLFSFPQSMKVILLVSIFLTIYLSIFLFFNLRQDNLTVIQNRLKNLQISLIEQYYDRKSDVDWTHWTRELEQRRDDIRAEVKQGIRTGQGRRSEEDIDSLIDKSWDELLAVIGSRKPAASGIDEEKLQAILNRILTITPQGAGAAVSAQQTAASPDTTALEPVEELEELEELPEEADLVEAVEDLKELPKETEQVSADDEAEEIEELEELPEEAEIVEASATDGETAEIQPPKKKSGGLLAAMTARTAEKTNTNAEIAIGDDDIPYVGETSGLELVDGNIDSAFDAMKIDDEIGELEELDAVEDLEVLENTMEGPAEEAPGSSGPRGPSESDIAELASQIEFSSPNPIIEELDSNNYDAEELEIVSPFSSMLSDFDGEDGSLTEELVEDTENGSEEITAPSSEDEKKNS